MSTTTTRTRGAETGPGRLSPVRAVWLLVAGALLVVGSLYARARWPGLVPLGSDNDEYQLVGRALASFEAPLVAGIEGTKYPLGYPAILALLEWLRLPVAPAALALNVAALAGSVALVAVLAGRATASAPASPGAALAAGAVVVTSVSIWNDAYSVMPELALLVVVGALLTAVRGPWHARRLAVLVGLSVLAVLLKTLALLIVAGGFGAVWLTGLVRSSRADSGATTLAAAQGRRSPIVLLPPVAAVVTVLAGMLGMRSLPEHTTGYLATFALRDPFDASQGTLGPGGLLRRTVADVPETLADLGRAIAWIDAGTGPAVAIALIGLTLGVVAAYRLWPGTALGPFVAGATLAYALGMATWPYHSSRFGIPLVPVAALGAGWLVRLATDWLADGDARPTSAQRWGSLLLGAGVAAGLVATSWSAVVDRGESASAQLARQHAAMEQLEVFAAEHLDDQRLVSFDYREVSRRLDRPVHPLSYTSDVAVLLEQVADADLVVMLDFHHVRNRQLDLLLEAEPARFTTVLEGDGLAVHRVQTD